MMTNSKENTGLPPDTASFVLQTTDGLPVYFGRDGDLPMRGAEVKARLGLDALSSLSRIKDDARFLLRFVDTATEGDALNAAMLDQTDYSETWPFMDWIDEAIREFGKGVRLLSVQIEGNPQPQGFIAFRKCVEIERQGSKKTAINLDLEIKFLFVSNAARSQGLAHALIAQMLKSLELDFRYVALMRNYLFYAHLPFRLRLQGDSFTDASTKLFMRTQGGLLRAGLKEFAREPNVPDFDSVFMVNVYEEEDTDD